MAEKVFAIEEYATPAVVEYLHIAFSFVVKEIVAKVVPDGNEPAGRALDNIGGLESEDGGAPLTGGNRGMDIPEKGQV